MLDASQVETSATSTSRDFGDGIHRETAATTVKARREWNYHSLTTAYDGITIYPASGNITGTIAIFGYRNA